MDEAALGVIGMYIGGTAGHVTCAERKVMVPKGEGTETSIAMHTSASPTKGVAVPTQPLAGVEDK